MTKSMARAIVYEQHSLPGLAAVGSFEYTAFGIRAPDMAKYRHEHGVFKTTDGGKTWKKVLL